MIESFCLSFLVSNIEKWVFNRKKCFVPVVSFSFKGFQEVILLVENEHLNFCFSAKFSPFHHEYLNSHLSSLCHEVASLSHGSVWGNQKLENLLSFFYNRTWTVDIKTLFCSILNQNTYSGRACLIESSFYWWTSWWDYYLNCSFAWNCINWRMLESFPNSGYKQNVPVGWTFNRLQTHKLASKCRLWRNVNPTLFRSTDTFLKPNEFVLAALFYEPFLLHHSNERPSSTSSKKNQLHHRFRQPDSGSESV